MRGEGRSWTHDPILGVFWEIRGLFQPKLTNSLVYRVATRLFILYEKTSHRKRFLSNVLDEGLGFIKP